MSSDDEAPLLKKDITVLVVPSMTFDLAYIELLKKEFNVVCPSANDVGNDKYWWKAGRSETQRNLLLLPNFDGLTNANKYLCFENLYVLSMSSEAAMKNFYLNKKSNTYYTSEENLSAGSLRKQLEDVAQAPKSSKFIANLIKDCGGNEKVFYTSSKALIE